MPRCLWVISLDTYFTAQAPRCRVEGFLQRVRAPRAAFGVRRLDAAFSRADSSARQASPQPFAVTESGDESPHSKRQTDATGYEEVVVAPSAQRCIVEAIPDRIGDRATNRMQIIVAPSDRYTYSATEWRGHLAHGEPAMGIACRPNNILSPIGATWGGLYSAGFIRRWTELVARGERIQPLIGDVVAQALLPVFTADAFLTLDTGKSACATTCLVPASPSGYFPIEWRGGSR